MAIVSKAGGGGGDTGGDADSAGDEAEVRTNLPPRTGPVCGRKPEMQSIVDLLNDSMKAREPGIVEVMGARGSGASSVAIELARRAGRNFPGGAWILRAGMGADLAWAEIAAARGGGLIDDLAASAAAERARLGAEPKALLVIDGARPEDDLAQLLPTPGPQRADVFVVSEQRTGQVDGVVEIGPVPDHAPRRIAHAVLRIREGDDVTPPVVRSCDGLALTASLAARVAVAYHPKGPALSMRDLKAATMRLIPLVMNTAPVGLEILLIASVGHPTLLSVDALFGAVAALRADRGGSATGDEMSKGILHLVRLGLLELEEESRVSMHPLLQEVVRGMAQTDADLEVARTALARGLLAEVEEGLSDDGVDVPRVGLHQLRHLCPDAPQAVEAELAAALSKVETALGVA